MMAKERDIDEAVKTLKRHGYRLRKPGPYKKTSVVVHITTFNEFRNMSHKLNYLLQEAITEALELWLDAKREEEPKPKNNK